jgi:hypothetical protein
MLAVAENRSQYNVFSRTRGNTRALARLLGGVQGCAASALPLGARTLPSESRAAGYAKFFFLKQLVSSQSSQGLPVFLLVILLYLSLYLNNLRAHLVSHLRSSTV